MIRSTAGAIAAKAAVIAGAILAATLVSAPATAQQASRMLCESINGNRQFCAQPGLTEAFVVQLLGGQCVANQNWTWGPQGITVDSGCRAVFGYRTGGYAGGNGGGYVPPPRPGHAGGSNGGGNNGGGQPILCQSMNFQPARCPMNTSGGVTIGMITNQPCRQGQTWGWDRGGVWVTGNCRAWFRPANGGGGNPGNGGGIGNGASMAGRMIECSSWQYKPARCPANTRNGVQLVNVIGGECIRNRSWGWDETAIWVNNGCRAQFRTN